MSPVNAHTAKETWAPDIARSVDMYNTWYSAEAPRVYRSVLDESKDQVAAMLTGTRNLRQVDAAAVTQRPTMVTALRMSASPPLAQDRLAGFAGVDNGHVKSLQQGKVGTPRRPANCVASIPAIADVLRISLDRELAAWLAGEDDPQPTEVAVFTAVVSDRIARAQADQLLKNAQEKRQLDKAVAVLVERGYAPDRPDQVTEMLPGTYTMIYNVMPRGAGNMPLDLIVQPKTATVGDMPILIEAKSAGDFANTNKRRKEEADKMTRLRAQYGAAANLTLLLGGYFNEKYLEHERDAGIDWIWEHAIVEGFDTLDI